MREKWPLFVLAIASSAVTWLVQNRGGAVGDVATYPLTARLANAAVASVEYLVKTVWPTHLAFFYPYPGAMPPLWQVAGAVLALVAITAAVVVGRRRRWLPVGWLWYLGTLVPVIGIVQVGEQRMADRYTYVPLIGVFVIASWALFERRVPRAAIVASGLVLAVLGALSYRQVMTWRNDVTLAEHALRVTTGNYKAHGVLGFRYSEQGDLTRALAHYREAVRLQPNHERWFNLGNVHRMHGDQAAAIESYESALRFRPDDAPALNNLGGLYFEQGRLDQAAACYERALRLDPGSADAHLNLGLVFERRGERGRALAEFREALRLRPDFAAARASVSRILAPE